MSRPLGVLVMAHGTPASSAEIASFYTRIRRGRPPTEELLADLTRRYDAIGGLSPLNERTVAQVDGIRRALEARAPGTFVVAYGAKHADPPIEKASGELVAGGVGGVVGLVLTPHGSSMGSGEYLERARHAVEQSVPFVEVPPWYREPALVTLLAQRVRNAVDHVEGGPVRVVFTAHSLPARVVEMGDTYPTQLEESARLVAEAAGVPDWSVAWQSAARTPEPWLGPDINAVIATLGEDDAVGAVVVCPIGFVSDHLEVLYDLDVEARASAARAGLGFARTTSLNDDPAFLAALADAVMTAAARVP